jgi:hypothetical protein
MQCLHLAFGPGTVGAPLLDAVVLAVALWDGPGRWWKTARTAWSGCTRLSRSLGPQYPPLVRHAGAMSAGENFLRAHGETATPWPQRVNLRRAGRDLSL